MGKRSKLQKYVSNKLSINFGGMTIRENHRPIWMMNECGQRLELDFFIEELRIAIEVQGIQHYEFTKYFHESYESFLNQVERDGQKLDICMRNNILLMHVFDIESADTAIDNIVNKLRARKVKESGIIKIEGIEGKGKRTKKEKSAENARISKMIKCIVSEASGKGSGEIAVKKMVELVRLYHSKDIGAEQNIMLCTIDRSLSRSTSKRRNGGTVYDQFMIEFSSLIERRKSQ